MLFVLGAPGRRISEEYQDLQVNDKKNIFVEGREPQGQTEETLVSPLLPSDTELPFSRLPWEPFFPLWKTERGKSFDTVNWKGPGNRLRFQTCKSLRRSK